MLNKCGDTGAKSLMIVPPGTGCQKKSSQSSTLKLQITASVNLLILKVSGLPLMSLNVLILPEKGIQT